MEKKHDMNLLPPYAIEQMAKVLLMAQKHTAIGIGKRE